MLLDVDAGEGAFSLGILAGVPGARGPCVPSLAIVSINRTSESGGFRHS